MLHYPPLDKHVSVGAYFERPPAFSDQKMTIKTTTAFVFNV